jgi:HSP20 family protein
VIERQDPFTRLATLPRIMDRLLDDVVGSNRDDQIGGVSLPLMNVYEQGDELIVETQLPGIAPDEVEVTMDNGILTIRGESRADDERKERNYLLREHRQVSFLRTLRLPTTVNADQAKAEFDQGVLRIAFPKAEHAKQKKINVSSNGQQARNSSTQAGTSVQGGASPQSTTAGSTQQTGSGNGKTAEQERSEAKERPTAGSRS